MKKLRILASAVALLTICLLLIGCGGSLNYEKASEQMSASMEKVLSVENDMSMYDGERKIYGYNKKFTVDGGNLVVATSESKFNTAFVLETYVPTYETVTDFDRQSLLQIDFAKDLFQNAEYGAEEITCTVPGDKLDKLFRSEGLAGGDAAVSCKFAAQQISEITVKYKTTSQKDVIISIKFTY